MESGGLCEGIMNRDDKMKVKGKRNMRLARRRGVCGAICTHYSRIHSHIHTYIVPTPDQ